MSSSLRADQDSVRSLDTWRPAPPGTGRLPSSIGITKEVLKPPPTERLWLKLPRSEQSKTRRSRVSTKSSRRLRNDGVERFKSSRRDSRRSAKPSVRNSMSTPKSKRPAVKAFKTQQLKNRLMQKLYQQSSSLRKIFRGFDVDKSGSLSRDEFRKVVTRMGFDPHAPEVDEVLNIVDADGNDSIDLAEFAAGFQGEDMDDSADSEAARRSYGKHAASRDELGVHMGVRQSAKTQSGDHRGIRITGKNSKTLIQPTVLDRKNMSQKDLQKLRIQQKVLQNIYCHTSDANQRARRILEQFRMCSPNDFGFIDTQKFHKNFGKQYGLSEKESKQLFEIGDPSGRQELDYSMFRNIFDPIDSIKQKKGVPIRTGKCFTTPYTGASSAFGNRESAETEHNIVASMSEKERKAHTRRLKLRQLIEGRKGSLQSVFLRHPTIGEPAGQVRTKLTYHELSEELEKAGLDVRRDSLDGGTLKKMYSNVGDDEGLTFSQLVKGNDIYFQKLGKSEDQVGDMKNYRKLHDIYGRRLGCRRTGMGIAGKAHLSHPGFLAHDDGRLGLAQAHEEEVAQSPEKRHRKQREEHSAEFNSGDGIAFAGKKTQWGSAQLTQGSSLAVGSSLPGGPSEITHSDSDKVVSYDHFVDDPCKGLWKNRWLDKNIQNRKYHRARKNRVEHVRQRQGCDMFSLLQSTARRGDPESTLETERSGRSTRRHYASTPSLSRTAPFALDE